MRDPEEVHFTYNEASGLSKVDRGESRSDRCREHRTKHRNNIQGMAVAYIDLDTVGEVADRQNPTGPLGGLGPLPDTHALVSNSVDLSKFGFGMDESHILTMLSHLENDATRVLIVKAGTGTGKSTYMPYRLLDPPDGAFRLTDLGPIVVTEPRVQATMGVAGFVGDLSGAGGVGPGFPIGYQVAGDRNHDDACQLIYVTDGTMINWLREGRLSRIGTVIVDEAHERSTNIDFIMGYLQRELARYPHLRVIITSATFNEKFYLEYFGGPSVANVVEVPASKTIGYGFPLFRHLDSAEEGNQSLAAIWDVAELPLRAAVDEETFVLTHWPTRFAPSLKDDEVSENARSSIGWEEDLHETTRALIPLRFQREIPLPQWKDRMARELGNFIVSLVKGLDEAEIFGDILGFLPTAKTIDEACEIIREGVGDRADVLALLSSLSTEEKKDALDARRKGDRRKIVVSTNLAETSLTVEGVRFVVDSGLIAQSEWDPRRAQGGIPTRPHSQAGIKQRWGRVGRKAPGWVFPLYSKAQFVSLAEDTPPGSTRDNLEQLVITAKMGGISDVVNFPWPASFDPQTVELDGAAKSAKTVFLHELERANIALTKGGALDAEGDPTSFGKELTRFQGLGSAANAIAVMHADRLACVPEVATILFLLDGVHLAGAKALLLDAFDWPDEWRFEAFERHRALASACADDAELVLQIMAVWERADPGVPPWEASAVRETWARRWWVNNDRLLEAAQVRRDVLASLSPAMKEEVKRFVEPALVRRARGAISRAAASLEYRKVGPLYKQAASFVGPDPATGWIDSGSLVRNPPERIIPLLRKQMPGSDDQVLANLVAFEPWAVLGLESESAPTGAADAMRLLTLAAVHARSDTARDVLSALQHAWPAGTRVQLTFTFSDGSVEVNEVCAFIEPPPMPSGEEITDEEIVLDEEGDDDDPATVEDARPELDTTWPAPNAAEQDPEEVLRRAVLDVEQLEIEQLACGQSARCLLGEPGDCLDPLDQVGSDESTDILAAWMARATRDIDVSKPLVLLEESTATDGTWYEVSAYEVDLHGRPAIILREDWRPSPSFVGIAKHPDLAAGDNVQLVVGPMVRDHRDPIRILHRVDGAGRFLLREAHHKVDKQEEQGQLAISLSRQHRRLLERLTEGATLTGTVIPRKQVGCSTVTLLELLDEHFVNSHKASLRKFDVNTRDGRTTEATFYPAIVVGEPNRADYADIEFLARDPETGIVHGLALYVGAAEPSETEDSPVRDGDSQALAKAPTTVGAPLLVRLGWEPAKLRLVGVQLAPIRAIAGAHKNLLLPDSEKDPLSRDGQRDMGADITEQHDIGGLDAILISRGVVSREAAEALADLDASSEWQSAVWIFWARSRHRRTDRSDSFRPGGSTTLVANQAALRKKLTIDEAASLYPTGSTVLAVVTKVRDDLGRAWLSLDDDVDCMTKSDSVGPRGVLRLSRYLSEGERVQATVMRVGEHNGAIQLQVALRDIPASTLLEQITDAGVASGARLRGQINNVSADYGLFVDHFVDGAPRISGLISIGNLPGRSVGSYMKGGAIEIIVVSVKPHRKREGDVEIGLRLA